MSLILNNKPSQQTETTKPRFIPLKEDGKSEKLDFSFSPNRSVDQFGWGMNLNQTFNTTDDVRKALDRAFSRNDVDDIRAISKHFFKVSGMYARAARYLAYLPTYDYLITPRIEGTQVEESNVIREVIKQLQFLEKLKLKQILPSITLDVIVEGVYYGYLRRQGSQAVMQKLPVNYCRTIKMVDGFPAVEFNLDYFEQFHSDDRKLTAALNSMPAEIISEYQIYNRDRREGNTEKPTSEKRKPATMESGNWTLLSSDAIAFYFNGNLQPLLANSFFSILDLLELKGIEKKKAENDLFNLVVQQFPLNDDGEPIFDIVEMKAFHDSAKSIFENEERTDLITTFGELKNIDLNESMGQPLDFKGWKNDIYSDFGISPQLFSTEGNMALEKSIQADEAVMFTIVEKYQNWFTFQLGKQFEVRMKDSLFDTSITFPPITVMNREKMAATYKDFATLGYSKFLPAIALGQSQLDILALTQFENSILEMGNIMDPLRSSHTSSSGGNGGKGGRPPKPDSEKSDKTIANQGG